MLEKYGLKPNDMCLAEEKHMPLFKDIVALPTVRYIAGGATQNSIRVAQWMLQCPRMTSFMGCVGDDDFAAKMRAACEYDGVRALYMVDPKVPTGCCAVLIHGEGRTMCTVLNCANNYEAEHLRQPEHWKLIEEARIVYSAGFFISASPESIELTSKEMARTGGFYCLNLAAPFLMHVPRLKAVFVQTMPYVDILFGNESEAQAWAESEGWETTDIAFIALRISLIPSAKERKRIVVFTQGHKCTVVAVGGDVSFHDIVPVPKDKLVDTNGAGDAYVGGFLAAFSKGLDVAACCHAGAYAASIIVQQSGCTFPERPNYAW